MLERYKKFGGLSKMKEEKKEEEKEEEKEKKEWRKAPPLTRRGSRHVY